MVHRRRSPWRSLARRHVAARDVTARHRATNAPSSAVASGASRIVERIARRRRRSTRGRGRSTATWRATSRPSTRHSRVVTDAAVRRSSPLRCGRRGGSSVAAPASAAGWPLSARYWRTSARALTGATTSSRPPWIASSGTGSARGCRLRARSARDRARRPCRRRLASRAIAVSGDDAAPQATPECTNDAGDELRPAHAEHRGERAAGRHAGDEHALAVDPVPAAHRADLRGDDRRLAAAARRSRCRTSSSSATDSRAASAAAAARGSRSSSASAAMRVACAISSGVCLQPWNSTTSGTRRQREWPLRHVDQVFAARPDPRRRREEAAQRRTCDPDSKRPGSGGLRRKSRAKQSLDARPEPLAMTAGRLRARSIARPQRTPAPTRRQISTMSYCSCV